MSENEILSDLCVWGASDLYMDQLRKQMAGSSERLTDDQRHLLNRLGSHVDQQFEYRQSSANKPSQLTLMLHGGPGVGKTYVIEKFTEMVEEAQQP
jgi:predicted ATPase